MVGFPCVTWIFGVLGEQHEKLCNVKGLVFVGDAILQNLSLFHLTFHPTLTGRIPIPLMWIFDENTKMHDVNVFFIFIFSKINIIHKYRLHMPLQTTL
jgi:hypothetical protein